MAIPYDDDEEDGTPAEELVAFYTLAFQPLFRSVSSADLLHWTRQLVAKPLCEATACAFMDWLIEFHGIDPEAARQAVEDLQEQAYHQFERNIKANFSEGHQ
jgi:hypothetical protein